MNTGGLGMNNSEWKKGYEEGFAAGWRAANSGQPNNFQNFPPVYYSADSGAPSFGPGPATIVEPQVQPLQTMADMPHSTMYGQNTGTVTLREQTEAKTDNPFKTSLRENVDSHLPQQNFNNIKAFMDKDRFKV